MVDSIKIKEKTYLLFYIINIVTSFLALYIVGFELGIVTYIQVLNLILSSLFIYSIKRIMKSSLYNYTMLSYYGIVVLFGMWFGLGSIHPLFIGYSIMFFQVILITSKTNSRLYIIVMYILLMLLLGLYDIYYRTVDFYPNQLLNIERLLSIMSFFIGNLLILHFNKSENDLAVKEIYRISFVDELTGSRNRHAYFEDIKIVEDEFLRYSEDYIIVYIDMDGLKNINDCYGHEEGDYAIKGLAKTMTSNMRSSDHFYRMGGDEFIIVIRHIEEEDLIKKIQYVKIQINKLTKKPYDITFSFGFARRSATFSLEETMKNADNQMYKMKKIKNTVAYSKSEKVIN